ncbi:MAG TPA: hypothetical protein VF624_17050 [Tepidisphaeraceae bacterium]|jgi:hypothetical protein
MSDVKAARALGWFSIGLGLAELLAPGPLQRSLGVGGHTTLLRGFGVRELASGAAILGSGHNRRGLAMGLWSRVAGDLLDLAALAAAREETDNPTGLAANTATVALVTAADLFYAVRLTKAPDVSKYRVSYKTRNLPALRRPITRDVARGSRVVTPGRSTP